MKILFLGDIVGNSGCRAIKENLQNIIKDNNIDFVIANGENAAKEGVGITENITNELFNSLEQKNHFNYTSFINSNEKYEINIALPGFKKYEICSLKLQLQFLNIFKRKKHECGIIRRRPPALHQFNFSD